MSQHLAYKVFKAGFRGLIHLTGLETRSLVALAGLEIALGPRLTLNS